MKVTYEFTGSRIVFEFKPSDKEREEFDQFRGMSSFYYNFVDDVEVKEPHPDKLALVAILNLIPFSKDELYIDWEVSSDFKLASSRITRTLINFRSSNYPSGNSHDGGLPSLAFSGGADSTAALCVMPNLTECVFHKRSKNPTKTLYDDHAALESCERIKLLGYKVCIVESNFEYLRRPIGFPTDLSVGTPGILLADTRGFSSIAYGTILESAFGTSGKEYRDYNQSSHYALWNNLFLAAGLFYSLPVAGVSEVGSTLICKKHPLGKVHQSCIRGKWGEPCRECWKCYRKGAILDALNDDVEKIKFDYIKRLISSREVKSKILNNSPIKHEGVLTYCLEKTVDEGDERLDALKKLVRVGIIETSWMEKWYQKSEDLIDPSYREEVGGKLSKILGTMSEDELKCLLEWKNKESSERTRILSGLKKLMLMGD